MYFFSLLVIINVDKCKRVLTWWAIDWFEEEERFRGVLNVLLWLWNQWVEITAVITGTLCISVTYVQGVPLWFWFLHTWNTATQIRRMYNVLPIVIIKGTKIQWAEFFPSESLIYFFNFQSFYPEMLEMPSLGQCVTYMVQYFQ